MDDNLDEIKADCVFVRGRGWMDKSFFKEIEEFETPDDDESDD